MILLGTEVRLIGLEFPVSSFFPFLKNESYVSHFFSQWELHQIAVTSQIQ